MKTHFLILGVFFSLSCNSHLLAQTAPCCTGVQGAQGPTGPQGIQGVPGPAGLQGIQGIPGPCCPNTGGVDNLSVNLYSLVNQLLPANGAATFELNSHTSSFFDISMAATTGAITVLQSGVYLMHWGAEGNLAPPFPAPVPSISFGVFDNGVLLPSSTAAAFTNSPDTQANLVNVTTIVELSAGDVVQLLNTSTLPFQASATGIVGSTVSICSFRMNLTYLTAL